MLTSGTHNEEQSNCALPNALSNGEHVCQNACCLKEEAASPFFLLLVNPHLLNQSLSHHNSELHCSEWSENNLQWSQKTVFYL